MSGIAGMGTPQGLAKAGPEQPPVISPIEASQAIVSAPAPQPSAAQVQATPEPSQEELDFANTLKTQPVEQLPIMSPQDNEERAFAEQLQASEMNARPLGFMEAAELSGATTLEQIQNKLARGEAYGMPKGTQVTLKIPGDIDSVEFTTPQGQKFMKPSFKEANPAALGNYAREAFQMIGLAGTDLAAGLAAPETLGASLAVGAGQGAIWNQLGSAYAYMTGHIQPNAKERIKALGTDMATFGTFGALGEATKVALVKRGGYAIPAGATAESLLKHWSTPSLANPTGNTSLKEITSQYRAPVDKLVSSGEISQAQADTLTLYPHEALAEDQAKGPMADALFKIVTDDPKANAKLGTALNVRNQESVAVARKMAELQGDVNVHAFGDPAGDKIAAKLKSLPSEYGKQLGEYRNAVIADASDKGEMASPTNTVEYLKKQMQHLGYEFRQDGSYVKPTEKQMMLFSTDKGERETASALLENAYDKLYNNGASEQGAPGVPYRLLNNMYTEYQQHAKSNYPRQGGAFSPSYGIASQLRNALEEDFMQGAAKVESAGTSMSYKDLKLKYGQTKDVLNDFKFVQKNDNVTLQALTKSMFGNGADDYADLISYKRLMLAEDPAMWDLVRNARKEQIFMAGKKAGSELLDFKAMYNNAAKMSPEQMSELMGSPEKATEFMNLLDHFSKYQDNKKLPDAATFGMLKKVLLFVPKVIGSVMHEKDAVKMLESMGNSGLIRKYLEKVPLEQIVSGIPKAQQESAKSVINAFLTSKYAQSPVNAIGGNTLKGISNGAQGMVQGRQ